MNIYVTLHGVTVQSKNAPLASGDPDRPALPKELNHNTDEDIFEIVVQYAFTITYRLLEKNIVISVGTTPSFPTCMALARPIMLLSI
jgi:hypothetical protein